MSYIRVVGDARTLGGKLPVLRSFGLETGETWAQARIFELSYNEARRLLLEKEATKDEIMAAFGQILGLENVKLACS
jgi:hypothetical protein